MSPCGSERRPVASTAPTSGLRTWRQGHEGVGGLKNEQSSAAKERRSVQPSLQRARERKRERSLLNATLLCPRLLVLYLNTTLPCQSQAVVWAVVVVRAQAEAGRGQQAISRRLASLVGLVCVGPSPSQA